MERYENTHSNLTSEKTNLKGVQNGHSFRYKYKELFLIIKLFAYLFEIFSYICKRKAKG